MLQHDNIEVKGTSHEQTAFIFVSRSSSMRTRPSARAYASRPARTPYVAAVPGAATPEQERELREKALGAGARRGVSSVRTIACSRKRERSKHQQPGVQPVLTVKRKTVRTACNRKTQENSYANGSSQPSSVASTRHISAACAVSQVVCRWEYTVRRQRNVSSVVLCRRR